MTSNRILLVGDHKASERSSGALTSAQFDVTTAATGVEAITALQSRPCDLLVIDESMPDMDPVTLVAALRGTAVQAPAILVTSRRDNDTTLRASQLGAVCLSKPIDADTLTRAVRDRLDARWSVAERARGTATVAAEPKRTVTATVVKNEFGRVMDTVQREGQVVITKHDSPRAVLVSYDLYQRLVKAGQPELDGLRNEFEALYAQMQTPEARAEADALFSISPSELGEAAVRAAERTAIKGSKKRG